MTRFLVLGAGFGGITAAMGLRRRLGPAADITVVEERTSFVMGLSHLWAAIGRRPLSQGERPIHHLARHGVAVKRGHVEVIDPAARQVRVSGETLPYDRLVVALGAELAPETIPGFPSAHNLYDALAIPALAEALQRWDGGRVLLAVAATPFKCPAAPYETALVLSEFLARRGGRTEIALSTPEPRPLPIAPASCSADVQAFLTQAHVGYHPDHKPVSVDAAAKQVAYANGRLLAYDLLIGVPPHRAPKAVRESTLAGKEGWIPVDAATLATGIPGVYAVGDVASVPLPVGKPLPKAGVLAESQAEVVAANLAAEAQGRRPDARFDGRGACYIEVGDGVATQVKGDFFDPRGPQLTLDVPTAGGLVEKQAFERQRLDAWFGG